MPKQTLFVILFAFFNFSFADSVAVSPSSHGPIGVMGEHIHKKGEVMASYRYKNMRMNGNRNGSSRVSNQEVLNDFAVTPTDMDMEMHMFGLMYAPSDNLTLMAMLPYVELSMNHLTRNGTRFNTSSSGIGDLKLTALYNLLSLKNSDEHSHIDSASTSKLIANFGISLPTGDIDSRRDIPVQDNARLPYPMQLGSGTVDLMPGLTYTEHLNSFSWGAQGIGTIRLDKNNNDYALGDRFESSVWASVDLCNWISTSLRTSWSIWGDVAGEDPELNPRMVPTADPDSRGGRRIDLGFGLNILMPGETFRLAVEYLVPVYQNLNGPQLETDSTWVFGAQFTF